MANEQNIYLGPATVLFSGTVGGISYDALDLGSFTTDGVTVSITSESIPVSTDQTGSAPARVFLGGQSATVTTPMQEEVFDNLYVAIPGAVSGTGSTNQLTFGRSAGYDLLSNWSGQLTVTPVNSNRRKWVFYQCSPTSNVGVPYNTSSESVLNVEWQATPVLSRSDGDRLGYNEEQS